MPTPSRGTAISGYDPAFSAGALIPGANIKDAAITSAKIAASAVVKSKMDCQVVTGSIISANIAYQKTHGLGLVPNVVIVTPWSAANEQRGVTSAVVVTEHQASAATSAKFYVVGNKGGVKFKAFLLI